MKLQKDSLNKTDEKLLVLEHEMLAQKKFFLLAFKNRPVVHGGGVSRGRISGCGF